MRDERRGRWGARAANPNQSAVGTMLRDAKVAAASQEPATCNTGLGFGRSFQASHPVEPRP